jgi:hypothetical protein
MPQKDRCPNRLSPIGFVYIRVGADETSEKMAPQNSLETNHLAADIVFRAGTLSLLPTPRFHKQNPEVVRVRVRPEREITESSPGLDLPIETRPLREPPKVTRLRRKRAAQKRPPKLPPVVEALRRARDYQRRIATGEAKDRADLARQLGFSRARVTQVLYLMELAQEIQLWVERLEASSGRPPITERRLRDLARGWPDPDDQLVELERMIGVALERDADRVALAAGQA